jgi:hypothetical protein
MTRVELISRIDWPLSDTDFGTLNFRSWAACRRIGLFRRYRPEASADSVGFAASDPRIADFEARTQAAK